MNTQLIELANDALNTQSQYSMQPSLYRMEVSQKARQALLDALEARDREIAELRWDRENLIGMGSRAAQANDTLRAELGAIRAHGSAALDITLNEAESELLYTLVSPALPNAEPSEIRLTVGAGHSGYGLYVSMAEYQDEGALLLRELAAPAASQDVGAMVEALRKVEWVEYSDPSYGTQNFCAECRADRLYGHYAGCTVAAALTQSQAARVPDGWKLVPVEPTKEMCVAAVKYANGDAVYKNVNSGALEAEEGLYSEAYAAMLAAAPGKGGV